MKNAALILISLWTYCLAVIFYESQFYWPAQVHFTDPWLLLIIAAFAGVPIVASLITYRYKLKQKNDAVSLSFVRSNRNQLIAYGIGALLMTISSGAVIMIGAMIAGLLLNVYFLLYAKKSS